MTNYTAELVLEAATLARAKARMGDHYSEVLPGMLEAFATLLHARELDRREKFEITAIIADIEYILGGHVDGDGVLFPPWQITRKKLVKLVRERESAQPAAWLIPSIITFKGVLRTSCPPEEQPNLEGTVAWSAEMFSDDEHTVTDKHGVTHSRKPLYTHPPRESAPTTELQMLPGDLQVLADLGFKQTAERIAAELKRARKSAPVVPNDDRDIESTVKHQVFVYAFDFGDEGIGRYVRLNDFDRVVKSLEAKP